MSGGYVYVIKFSDGTVKVGRSVDADRRLKDHDATARSFGLQIADQWVSPRHRDWKDNERELMRLARELGGLQNNGEYFSGVAFAELAAAAGTLPFLPPELEPARRPGRGNAVPPWLKSDFKMLAECSVPYGDCTPDEAVAYLADRALREDPDLVRVLIERHMRKGLLALLPEEFKPTRTRPVKHSDPEPPDPESPLPAGTSDLVVPFRQSIQLAAKAA